MTARRAWLGGVVLALLGLGLAAPAVHAATSDWTVDKWYTDKATLTSDSPASYEAGVTHDDFRSVTGTVGLTALSVPSGCAAPQASPESSTASGGFTTSVTLDFLFTVQAECNGTYSVSVIASVDAVQGSAAFTADQYELTPVELDVARPAPAVSGVAATPGKDRSVQVTWNSLAASASGAPKDLTGYLVTRSDGTTTKSFTVTDPGATSFTDTSVPPGGGTFTYSVSSTRFAVGPSKATAAKAVTVDPIPLPPTTAAPPTTTAGPAGSPPTVSGAPAAGGAPRVSGGGSSNPGVAPSGTAGAAIGGDEGFETALPYEAEPGAVAAKLPGASDEGSGVAGAGLLVPFAVALLLGVWGTHIALITRSARVASDALALLDLELE